MRLTSFAVSFVLFKVSIEKEDNSKNRRAENGGMHDYMFFSSLAGWAYWLHVIHRTDDKT
jgi:hypothetical protein